MSIWLLVVVAFVAWTVVMVAVAVWMGRLLRDRRRRTTAMIDFTSDSSAFRDGLLTASQNFQGAKGRLGPFDREGQDAA